MEQPVTHTSKIIARKVDPDLGVFYLIQETRENAVAVGKFTEHKTTGECYVISTASRITLDTRTSWEIEMELLKALPGNLEDYYQNHIFKEG